MKRRAGRYNDEERKGTSKARKSSSTSKNTFKCKWLTGSKLDSTCTEYCASRDDLLKHVTEQHNSRGPKGFVCKWAQCGSRNSAVFLSSDALKKHITNHIFKTPQIEEPFLHSSDENELDYASSTDEDDDYDYSSEVKARKATKSSAKRKKGAEPPKAKINQATETSSATVVRPVAQKVNTSISLSDTSSFFFRFVCEWQVSALQYGMNASSNSIKCKRKFSKLLEAIDHLHNHHISKLEYQAEPFQCAWLNCESGVFSDVEDIKKHMEFHAKGEEPPPAQGANSKSSGAEGGKSGSKASKNDSGVTWYSVALHALVSCKSLPTDHQTCNSTCYFCRYFSLKDHIEKLGSSTSTILSEFSDLLNKFEACKDDPFKFISTFLALATDHEELNHRSNIIKDTFWIEDLKQSDLKCQKHMDHSLINFFPALYKNCSVCCQNSKRWPTIENLNLILALDTSVKTKIDQIIFVKGREYQLKAIISRDTKTGNYHAHTCDSDNDWMTFRDDLVPIDSDKVLKDKGSCIVIYTNYSACDQAMRSNVVEDVVQADIDTTPPSPVPIPPQMERTRQNDVNFNGNFQPVVIPLAQPETNYHICSRKDGEFHPGLASRKLFNSRGTSSCINSVLQAVLTTGISVIAEKLCDVSKNCFLCQVLSVSQRVFSSKEDRTTDPFELLLNRTQLGVPKDVEGNPTDYIKKLVEKLAADEETKHHSSKAKYKLTILFQRKCPCRESYETRHWTVNPSKKNDSLRSLMAQHSLYCDKCRDVALAEAVQLPETLIITVETEQHDISLHYPEEMPFRNGRYFLAAVIVAESENTHFSTYCRVFGKWLHYNDEKEARQVSCGDVLGLRKNIRVLVYVTSELTVHDIGLSLAKSKELRDKRIPFVVKEERDV